MESTTILFRLMTVTIALHCTPAVAFDSGSTGADGDLNPTASITVPLPSSGVLNYRNVNVPMGVTVTFTRNAANTPVTMLVQRDAIIAGTVDVSGASGGNTGSAAGASLSAEGLPGAAGPGGFDGGRGGPPGPSRLGPKNFQFGPDGGAGLGPGGGGGGFCVPGYSKCIVGGGGFGSSGGGGSLRLTSSFYDNDPAFVYANGGNSYGNAALLPLVGGSGGGGGGGGQIFHGAGGGGGGGAIVIAVTGRLELTGAVRANGGSGGYVADGIAPVAEWTGCGGGGSGGAIRLVATTFSGDGPAIASPGVGQSPPRCWNPSSGGGGGRVRMEAEFAFRPVDGLPQPIVIPSTPSLRFVTIGGMPVPAIPVGDSDIVLAQGFPNPVAVVMETTGVPVGSIVRVRLSPRVGPVTEVDAAPTIGAQSSASTSASFDIPPGHSVLSAWVTFTLTLAQAEPLTRFAQGERVEKVTLSSTLGQGSKATLHTVSGREFPIEPALLALAALPH